MAEQIHTFPIIAAQSLVNGEVLYEWGVFDCGCCQRSCLQFFFPCSRLCSFSKKEKKTLGKRKLQKMIQAKMGFIDIADMVERCLHFHII